MSSRHALRLLVSVAFVARAMSAVVFAAPGAPVLNNNQPVQQSGSTVTLVWTAPAVGLPTGYIVEAATTAGGPPDIVSHSTGNTQTALVVPGVPDGVYYIRVRALDATGQGPASNEVQLIVGTPAVCPSAPRSLAIAAQNGGNVTFAWQAPLTGTPTSYALSAGTAPGLSNIVATADLGSTALAFAVGGVPPGAYYVRVQARGAGCPAPALLGPASNEVLLSVGSTGLSAPALNGNLPTQSSGPTVTLSWTAPSAGLPTSYVIEAAVTPAGAALVSFNTGSTQTSLTIPNVGPGTYYVRVRGVDAGGTGPVSNEVALTVGTSAAWGGVIECKTNIAGMGYAHQETQRWVIGLPKTPISGARDNYTALWSATGSGGHSTNSWTISQSATTDLSATLVASTQLMIFDRTTTPIVIPNGIVTATPPSFTLGEMDFPTISAPAPNATLVTGTYSRPTVGGDSPQQPGGASGTFTCTWTLRFQ